MKAKNKPRYVFILIKAAASKSLRERLMPTLTCKIRTTNGIFTGWVFRPNRAVVQTGGDIVLSLRLVLAGPSLS